MLTATMAGCGNASHPNRADRARDGLTVAAAPRYSPASSSSHPTDGDGDGDNNDDENDIRRFGHEAGAAQRRAISDLLGRYRAATSHHDWTTVCSLLDPVLAVALAGGHPTRAGCVGSVANLLSRVARQDDAVSLAHFTIASIRLDRHRGFAILRLPGGEERYMPFVRHVTSWLIGNVYDQGTI